MIEIETDVPVPKLRRKRGKELDELRDALAKLEISQSLTTPAEDNSRRMSLGGVVYNYGRQSDKVFITRFLKDEKKMRVWRVA